MQLHLGISFTIFRCQSSPLLLDDKIASLKRGKHIINQKKNQAQMKNYFAIDFSTTRRHENFDLREQFHRTLLPFAIRSTLVSCGLCPQTLELGPKIKRKGILRWDTPYTTTSLTCRHDSQRINFITFYFLHDIKFPTFPLE